MIDFSKDIPPKVFRATYQCWSDMKQRCYNKRCRDWPNYGGRGISVCERWLEDFQNFLEDMGPKPEGLTIDRVDVNGNYCKSNCRWLSREEQCRNRRERKSWAGVRFNKRTREWEVRAEVYGEKTVIGFQTKEEADQFYGRKNKCSKAKTATQAKR
jgi:hypothetical protein